MLDYERRDFAYNTVGACKPCNVTKGARRIVDHACELCDRAWTAYGPKGRWLDAVPTMTLLDLLEAATKTYRLPATRSRKR